ncbi:hypothetical protein EYZ11_002455 [Aspergillus tanneri]|uniref:SET domain-containing protein n=1 Tax=Aspergillus tanneri TaxID=1220188 RepID=A0A4S3JQM7_9EURO|nr:hypothetical protein EYZ11_002455 [Aspergillus tanneri]
MRPNCSPGEEHELFTEWAISQGIIINGEDEAIVTVPLKAMLTTNSIPSSFISKFPGGCSVHTLYAAFFTNGDPEDLQHYDAWRKTWPSRQDFENTMPILWPSLLRDPISKAKSHSSPRTLLPPSISGSWNSIQKGKREYEYESRHQNLLARQEKRLRDAWDTVVAVFPDISWEAFSYHWLIVNTRSFFFLMPGQEPPEDRNEAMALLPFADYFNHSDVACNVKFDGRNYIFRATKHYDKGEEIYMSYGPHPNDFLYTEYGFYLDENKSETLYLDDVIFRDLSANLQRELEFEQYYGNYQLTASGVCYRTEVAACIKYMALGDWRSYVLGYSTKGVDADKTNEIIQGWIKTYSNEANTTITSLEKIRSSKVERKDQEKIDSLLKRWSQIEELCDQAQQSATS